MGASFICEQMVFKNINLEFGYTAAISCTENKYVNRMDSFKRFFFSYSIILTEVVRSWQTFYFALQESLNLTKTHTDWTLSSSPYTNFELKNSL